MEKRIENKIEKYDKELHKQLVDRLNQVRALLNLNKSELARLLGLKYHNIRDYFSGKTRISQSFINNMCKTCGVSKEWFLTGEGEMIIDKATPFDIAQKKSSGELYYKALKDEILKSNKKSIAALQKSINEMLTTNNLILKNQKKLDGRLQRIENHFNI